nr:hypothetical protein [Tanacetum cinerariifolium]
MIRSATCHHLSGTTWHIGGLPSPSPEPPVNGDQRRSTVANHRGPPPDLRRNTSQPSSMVVGTGSGQVATWTTQRVPRGSRTTVDHHRTTARPPPEHHSSTVTDGRNSSLAGSGRVATWTTQRVPCGS